MRRGSYSGLISHFQVPAVSFPGMYIKRKKTPWKFRNPRHPGEIPPEVKAVTWGKISPELGLCSP